MCRIRGCVVEPEARKELDDKSRKGVFVGYSHANDAALVVAFHGGDTKYHKVEAHHVSFGSKIPTSLDLIDTDGLSANR